MTRTCTKQLWRAGAKLRSWFCVHWVETLALQGATHWSTHWSTHINTGKRTKTTTSTAHPLVSQKLEWSICWTSYDIQRACVTQKCWPLACFVRHFFPRCFAFPGDLPCFAFSKSESSSYCTGEIRACLRSDKTKCNTHLWYGMIWIDDLVIS